MDDDFIIRYGVVDDEIFVYYKDGRVENFLYNAMLERKIILKMKKQLMENVMFKKMMLRTYTMLSLV